MFEDLKRDVFPAIVNGKPEGPPVRVWVPGCSTGQEAYSLAMALSSSWIPRRPSGRSRSSRPIWATRASSTRRVPASTRRASRRKSARERLRRFFIKEDRHYRIQKSVRDLCIFARQNVTVDPPFSRVDLVTCRNVLIYMSPPLQERLVPVFHFALNPGGFLVLGVAETVGSFDDLFELTNRAHKNLPTEGNSKPASADVYARRVACRHASEAARRHQSAAQEISSEKRTGSCSAATRRPARW